MDANTNLPSQDGAGQALDSASAALFDRHRPEAPNADQALAQAPGSANPALDGVMADSEGVRKFTLGVLRRADKSLQAKLSAQAKRIPDPEALEVAKSAALTDAHALDISESTAAVLAKHNLAFKY